MLSYWIDRLRHFVPWSVHRGGELAAQLPVVAAVTSSALIPMTILNLLWLSEFPWRSSVPASRQIQEPPTLVKVARKPLREASQQLQEVRIQVRKQCCKELWLCPWVEEKRVVA